MWEAKLATITRLGARDIIDSITGAISFSCGTKPGTSAFVESTKAKSTPSSPNRAKVFKSVIRPSSGN